MNRSEAIQFYSKKEAKARGEDAKIAYQCILDACRVQTEYKAHIQLWSSTSPSPTRRAIYRKAIGELSI